MKDFDLLGFANHLLVLQTGMALAQTVALTRGIKIIEHEAKRSLGEYQGQAGPFIAWPELADRTKDDRVRQGYPENEPGLRSGEVRRSIGHRVGFNEAHTGSDHEHLVAFELGTPNQPPRSVLGSAAVRKADEVAHHIGKDMVMHLAGPEVVGGKIKIDP